MTCPFGFSENPKQTLIDSKFQTLPVPDSYPGDGMVKGLSHLFNTSGHKHQYMRSVIRPFFTRQKVKTYKNMIDFEVDWVLAGLPTNQVFDFSAEVANKIPARVMGNLLGIPMKRAYRLYSLINQATSNDGVSDAEYQEILAIANHTTIDHYSELNQAIFSDKKLTLEEKLGLWLFVFGAGTETTSIMINKGIQVIANAPYTFPLVSTEITDLVKNISPLKVAAPRTNIDTGETVLVDLEGLGFGLGDHRCLGENLARLELETVFNTLFTKYRVSVIDSGVEREALHLLSISGMMVKLKRI